MFEFKDNRVRSTLRHDGKILVLYRIQTFKNYFPTLRNRALIATITVLSDIKAAS